MAVVDSWAARHEFDHSAVENPPSIIVDVSENSVGGVLQQYVNNHWQLLAFFSMRLTPIYKRYSTYNRELFAMHSTGKHFQYDLQDRQLTIFTDHKALIFAFKQPSNKASQRYLQYLEFITQYRTTVRHTLRNIENSDPRRKLSTIAKICK
ncbi:polyprotein [Trichonephila clavipes]|uniref:Polyprotein n=1 Tax=Trichonephila clavipes TaxID=2585209 RepID=A0A8X6VGX8_TRICX|nr:polyprotein [Trichonephila clavipes]